MQKPQLKKEKLREQANPTLDSKVFTRIRALGEQGDNDAQRALALLQAADAGNVRAQFFLAHSFQTAALCLPKDLRKARAFYSLAAANGDAKAQYELARMFDAGEGGRRDAARAMKWFEKAAAQGDEGAKRMLKNIEERPLPGKLPLQQTKSDEKSPKSVAGEAITVTKDVQFHMDLVLLGIRRHDLVEKIQSYLEAVKVFALLRDENAKMITSIANSEKIPRAIQAYSRSLLGAEVSNKRGLLLLEECNVVEALAREKTALSSSVLRFLCGEGRDANQIIGEAKKEQEKYFNYMRVVNASKGAVKEMFDLIRKAGDADSPKAQSAIQDREGSAISRQSCVCDRCHGTGKGIKCWKCNGEGELRSDPPSGYIGLPIRGTCDVCYGRGYDVCASCGGNGIKR
jgi:hypothetical protein